ncbi:hypothetical protein O6H91_06G129300 [Diphasiastrum complanatum]|uniref:Uncharacterized protein n=1 Tax=Diphasiastrum complanatum TaxID=34168 RepID=A0ACC2DIP6_DIPCM|nr:hypothetical protein O6H91_06G129300 [Diphasiastrum complanatum]
MFVKRIIQKATSEFPSQVGSLKGLHVEPRLIYHYGIPATASILAYDPLQHLLAIATSDGRIKLFGGDGVEGLLHSNSQASSRFLEFMDNRGILVHITTHNHIELWSLEKRQLVHVRKWATAITAFAVIQGSPFMYIGDESGAVLVLEYNQEDQLLSRMPYCIPAHIVLGETTKSEDIGGPSVVSILPQPESLYSRVLIVYGNGLICLWGLHECLVLAIRGGTEAQYRKFTTYMASGSVPIPSLHSISDDEDEEKEICCACWACPAGSIVAVGYTDGDIYLWGLPVTSKGKGQMVLENSDSAFFSHTPILKLELSQGVPRMPVVVLRWCADGKGEAGRLYVFGGHQLGRSEVLTVLPLELSNGEFAEKVSSYLELPLHGAFSDVILLPTAASNSSIVASAVLVLTAPGKLDIYDEVDITNCLKSANTLSSNSLPASVPFKLPLTNSSVTAAKLVLLPVGGTVANILSQIPIAFKSYVPPILKSGIKWPVIGGTASFGVSARESEPRTLYITGHEDGSVNMWDISSMSMFLVASLEMQCHAEARSNSHSAISAIDFCAFTGLLAVGSEDGLVSLYTLSTELREIKCHFVNTRMKHSEKSFNCAAGLQCLAVLDVHHSSIQSVVISKVTSCLAIGDEHGLVSLFELNSFSLYYQGKCFPDGSTGIVAIHLFRSMSAHAAPHSSAFSEKCHSGSVAYILAKDSSMVAIDIISGAFVGSGPLHPRNPSIAVSMHLLDSSGAPATLSRTKKRSKEPTSEDPEFLLSVDAQENTANVPQSPTAQRHEEHSVDEEFCSSDSAISSNELLLLLCSEDCLRLYAAAAVTKGDRSTVRKVKLSGHCYQAELFESRTVNIHGLVLLYKSGIIEFRSLPDMELLKEQSLSLCLNWRFELSLRSMKVSTCSVHGRIALIDGDELMYLSLIEEEDALRLPSSPHLYDKVVAAATNAALTAPFHSVKRKSQIQDLLGGVIKELRSSVGSSDQFPANHAASELHTLFAREPFQMSNVQTNSAESNLDEPLAKLTAPSLEIDDIEIEDDDFTPTSPATSKMNIVKKLKESLPGTSVKKLKENLPGTSLGLPNM